MSSPFMKQDPFPHLILDNFIEPDAAEALYQELSSLDPDDSWYDYNNKFELKRATDNTDKMPASVAFYLSFMNSQKVLPKIEKFSGIEGLIPDPYMRGGGVHMILPGGFLDIHADRQIHPKLKLYRRLNLLIYMNKDYKPEYGGQLELWDRKMSKCKVSIEPIFNRAVLFETDKTSYHGHPTPWSGPTPRRSLALYYWTARVSWWEWFTKLNKGSTLFKRRPQDPVDLEKEKMRKQRSKWRLSSNV